MDLIRADKAAGETVRARRDVSARRGAGDQSGVESDQPAGVAPSAAAAAADTGDAVANRHGHVRGRFLDDALSAAVGPGHREILAGEAARGATGDMSSDTPASHTPVA